MKMRSMWWAAGVAALSVASLSACDQKLASQPARDHRSVDGGSASEVANAGETTGAARTERTDVSLGSSSSTDAKPMWSDNRQHSAEENAQYQFEHHGQELGAANLDDFLTKAHRFVNSPPEDALTLTRANGDRLLYDPKSGLFGVVRSDGAPRTVTKPADGRAFWDKQVAENKDGGDSAYRRRTAAKSGGDGQS